MSGNAANDISNIVEKSLKVANAAIHSTRQKIESLIEETTARSAIGYSNARQCEAIFAQMGAKVQETTRMIDHIFAAASEQAQGVAQLDQSLSKFQEVADRNRLIASQGTEHSRSFKSQVRIVADLAQPDRLTRKPQPMRLRRSRQ